MSNLELQNNNVAANRNGEFEKLSDGFHTIGELYDHRAALLAALIKDNPYLSWKSKLHSDGTMFDGYFIVGIELPYTDGPITYHYPLEKWDMFKCKIIDRAPKWDGSTPEDCIKRLIQYVEYDYK